MPSALASRFEHIFITEDLDDWCSWAVKNDIEPSVIGCLRFRPELLMKFDRNEKAFPSPRAWEFTSNLLKAGIDGAIELAVISGAVGQGAASEYLAFKRVYSDLPDIDKLLANPSKASIGLNGSLRLRRG